jgi:hypothetical protein
MNHRITLTAAAVALVAGGAGPALAAAHPVSHPVAARAAHQRFAADFVTVNGKDRPTHVVAAGPIAGRGTLTQKMLRETRDGAVLLATVSLPDGKVRLRVHDTDTLKLDLRSCTARQSGTGTWRIVSGTGAYAAASGSGTFVRRTFIVGAFGDDGRCLGESAEPAAVTGTVVLDGSASE